MATAALRYLRANGYQFNLPSYFCASSKELIRIDDLSFISYLVNRASHGADFRVLWDEEIQGNAFLTFPGDSF